MRNGISTASLYPMETEKSLDLLLSYGYRLFEFFVNAFSEITKGFMEELKNRAAYHGAGFCSMHPFTCALEGNLFFGDYGRRFDDGVDLYKRYFEAAEFMGCSYFVLHGQSSTRSGTYLFSDEQYFERYSRLAQAAKEFGVTLCQENVFGFRSHSAGFIKKMTAALGDGVHYVFDVKQALNSGESIDEMLAAMGKQIRHVHLSDNSENSTCLLPGAGNYDIGSFLHTLNGLGYQGDVITEVYRHSYSQYGEIQKSRIFMDEILKKH